MGKWYREFIRKVR